MFAWEAAEATVRMPSSAAPDRRRKFTIAHHCPGAPGEGMGRLPDATEESRDLHVQLSTAIIHAQKESWGKGPEHAKSYLLDDFLMVVLRGGLTKAEETMLAAGQVDHVRDFRRSLQDHAATRYISLIEELTGRKVATYQSQILFDPTILIETFFFDDSATGGRAATTTAAVHRELGAADAVRNEATLA